MKELYYGLWKSFLRLDWTLRLLLELCLVILLTFCILSIIEKSNILNMIKKIVIAVVVIILTNIVYIFLRTSDRAKDIDRYIEEWGIKMLHKQRRLSRKIILICALTLYCMAIFVDMPFSSHINDRYLNGFQNIKDFCLKIESHVSCGYEGYPDLIVVIGEDGAQEEKEEPLINETIYITLNDVGKYGTNVREEPSLDAPIVGGVTDGSEIIYNGDFSFDGQRYWIYIYVCEDDIYGWISGNLIVAEQLNQIVK